MIQEDDVNEKLIAVDKFANDKQETVVFSRDTLSTGHWKRILACSKAIAKPATGGYFFTINFSMSPAKICLSSRRLQDVS